MSAGSDASQLGYGKITPLSNVNRNYVHTSNNPANFGSNEIPGLPGLAGAKNNVDAAAGKVPGICVKGGSRTRSQLLKGKIKNITKYYKKMKGGKRRLRSIKKQIRSKVSKTKRRRSVQRGGYSQYQNNLPMSQTYATGGVLPASRLAEANPVPYKAYPNCANCGDNYNHYNGKTFASRGH